MNLYLNRCRFFDSFLFFIRRDTPSVNINKTGMKAIIVNHDQIYGSIGLYISLSIDFRDHFFRYFFSGTAYNFN